jgi:hypothetical protein
MGVLQISGIKPLPGRGSRLLEHRFQTDPPGQGQNVTVWANPAGLLLCPTATYNS